MKLLRFSIVWCKQFDYITLKMAVDVVSQTLQVIAIMSNICFSRSINSIANNKCCRSPGYWARTCFQHLGTLFTLSPEVQLIFLLYFDVNPVIC